MCSLPAIPTWTLAAPPQAPKGTPIELPELPSRHERFPNIWDEDGCVIGETPTPGVISCQEARSLAVSKNAKEIPSAKAKELTALSSEQLNKTKNLLGFEGPYYTPLPSANAVVVLPETITTSATTGGSFSAVGLIRNEIATQFIGAATITAELIGSSGQILGKATAEAMVTPIRPGEPVPFQLTTAVPFKDVTDVRWSVKWSIEPDRAKAGYREVLAGNYLNYGALPWGNREPTEWDTAAKPPYPYLEIGTTENFAGIDIPNPEIIVAWYTETNGSNGKIISVTTIPLYEPSEPPIPASVLPATASYSHKVRGRLFYAITIDDRKFAKRVDVGEIKKMVWVTGGE